jgi:nucleoid DNA-binding protein
MIRNYGEDMANKLMSKSELIQKIAEKHSDTVTRKDVKSVVESLAEIGYKELKKTGAFLVPGFAKFVVIKKPATKARKGVNPFTKEPTVFKAKPARKIIKAPSKGYQRRSGLAPKTSMDSCGQRLRSPNPTPKQSTSWPALTVCRHVVSTSVSDGSRPLI